MARPSPVPPNLRVVLPSACTKGWNKLSRTASGMPIPVSETSIRNIADDSVRCNTSADNATEPSEVNLTALPSRFARTCCNRPLSPEKPVASAGSMSQVKCSFFLCAEAATNAAVSSTKSLNSKDTGSIRILPASIFEKSRISLIMTSSRSALFESACAISR